MKIKLEKHPRDYEKEKFFIQIFSVDEKTLKADYEEIIRGEDIDEPRI